MGNFIYPHVVSIIGESLAPKVTGMCLELPVAELALIMQGVEHLKSAVEQAMAVLPPDMKSQRSPAAKASASNSAMFGRRVVVAAGWRFCTL